MTMEARKAAYERLLAACAGAFEGPLAELATFTPGALPGPDRYVDWAPVEKPVIHHLHHSLTCTTPALREVAAAIVEGAPHFHWLTSYREEDGVSADFMERYGYFNLVTPEGPFLCDDYRLTVAFWGAGLIYPEHWHEPEEMYSVVAGAARFRAAGRAARDVGVGEFVEHGSNQIHATDMIPGPLLSVICWRGGNIMKFPEMDVGQSV